MDYGKRDFRSNGSYVTTRWFVFLHLPIFPLHSKRLRATGEVKYYGMRRVPTIVIEEKTRPNLKQVLCVYSWFAAVVAIFVAAEMTRSWWLTLPAALLLALPWMLRRRAMDRLKAEVERQRLGFAPSLPE